MLHSEVIIRLGVTDKPVMHVTGKPMYNAGIWDQSAHSGTCPEQNVFNLSNRDEQRLPGTNKPQAPIAAELQVPALARNLLSIRLIIGDYVKMLQ